RKANIHGWELGSQYFFGDSGFGIQANYTKVSGDVGIDDAAAPGVEQFALTGLSDTANVVFMYEKYGWTARLAWNWRDEYLFAANQGNSTNPFYVEDYQQWDFSVTKQLNDNWSVGLEAINLTGEDVRWRARTNLQMLRLLDQSPRYTAAVRYTCRPDPRQGKAGVKDGAVATAPAPFFRPARAATPVRMDRRPRAREGRAADAGSPRRCACAA